MSDVPAPAAPSIPQALGRLRVALNNSFSTASREAGLTPQQAELLCYALTPRSIGELAGLLHCDRSNVSHLVDRASNRGLLLRRPGDDDARVSMIELTDSGRALASDFMRRLDDLTLELRQAWTPRHATTATNILTEIAETLETRTI
ncbi:MarR family winged helix-turn-helix transcriptional regulator [Nocardia sp. NPDC056000]|uniref:MarR family winged helix-turn-helix transcriptional regulator n=1 Tax=Nocardia sp. NPDC056000 TaxID=3345674 RepID=UPI0035D91E8D